MRILFPTFLRVGSRECSVELGPAFGQFLPNGRIMDHRTTGCRHPLRCVGTTSTSVTITTSRLSISTPILKYRYTLHSEKEPSEKLPKLLPGSTPIWLGSSPQQLYIPTIRVWRSWSNCIYFPQYRTGR